MSPPATEERKVLRTTCAGGPVWLAAKSLFVFSALTIMK